MAERFEVVIVGGGPVGVALAVDLGQRGVSVALVERNREPVRIPKGQNLTARTLEHFYFWNCVEALRNARVMPPGYPIGGLTAYGNLMSDYWYVQGAAIGRGSGEAFYFQRNERLPQYLTEAVLRARAAELPSVACLYGWSAEGIEHDDNGGRVTATDAGWASERVLECDYLVGCDGGRSQVRQSLGIDLGGEDFDQRMVLAVFRSRELHEGLRRFPERTTYRVLKPELQGYWQFFGRIDVGEGWFFHAPVPKDTSRDNYDFHGLVKQAAGFEFAATFDHVGFWDLRINVASQYSQGRVFIAGDACHTHPPYGGFGLNTGLEDVTNLGWKLAAVLQGWGGEALLDSYHAERQPVFVETGEAMIAGGIERDRQFLERYSPGRDQSEFETAWKTLSEDRRAQSYEPHYEGSAVVNGPEGGVCSIHGTHTLAAQAGHHLAPQALSSGKSTFEALGQGFTLLAFGAEERDVESLKAAAASANVPLTIVRDDQEEGRASYESKLVLVRPDQYVAWTGDAAPSDSPALLKMVTGQV